MLLGCGMNHEWCLHSMHPMGPSGLGSLFPRVECNYSMGCTSEWADSRESGCQAAGRAFLTACRHLVCLKGGLVQQAGAW